MPRSLHHAALCVRDLDQSLRFYRDGLGLELLMDHEFDGDWLTLFDAPVTTLRSVFLGDRTRADAGIVELVVFGGSPAAGGDDTGPVGPPASGFFLLSFFVDVDTTLGRLRDLGLETSVRRIEQPGAAGTVAMATVRDPDGTLVELIQAHDTGA